MYVHANHVALMLRGIRAEVVKSTDDSGYSELIQIEAVAPDGQVHGAEAEDEHRHDLKRRLRALLADGRGVRELAAEHATKHAVSD